MKPDSLSPAARLVELLSDRGWTVTFAESCTAGLAAATLVDVPGASRVFRESYVTYANGSKETLLGVSRESVERLGVVSEEVAGQMALGAARKSGAEAAVGISGIAGPDGGTPEKPVGTVCFGFCVRGRVTTQTVRFGPLGRRAVREASVAHAFSRLSELIRQS